MCAVECTHSRRTWRWHWRWAYFHNQPKCIGSTWLFWGQCFLRPGHGRREHILLQLPMRMFIMQMKAIGTFHGILRQFDSLQYIYTSCSIAVCVAALFLECVSLSINPTLKVSRYCFCLSFFHSHCRRISCLYGFTPEPISSLLGIECYCFSFCLCTCLSSFTVFCFHGECTHLTFCHTA